jgi:nucleotide-binding universal stress UspA family protein
MYKKVLVPLDGSTLSELALTHAVNVVSGYQIPKLIIINVIEPFKDLAHWVSDDIAQKMHKEATRVAQNYLDQTVKRLTVNGVNAEAVLAEGNPGQVILEFADKSDCDLIIMSTHGRSGFFSLLFGSVASRIIHNSHVPVLLVPPHGLASKNNQ